MKKSWRTTLGGLLAAIGQGLVTGDSQLGDWAAPVGQILTMVGLVFMGINGRDNKVSSEQAGAVDRQGGP